MKNKNDFEYKYVAPTSAERKEIENIRDSYIADNIKQSSKLDYLRKLDSKVRNIPTIISLVIGIVSILIFGLGLTMILEWNLIILGIVISVVGIIPMIANYFVFNMTTKKLKNKYSEEILKISGELLGDEVR